MKALASEMSTVAFAPTWLPSLWHAFTWWRDGRRELAMYQRGSNLENMIWTLDGGATGFFFNIAIVNNSPRATVVITDFDLEIPWRDPQFRLLEDPMDLVP